MLFFTPPYQRIFFGREDVFFVSILEMKETPGHCTGDDFMTPFFELHFFT